MAEFKQKITEHRTLATFFADELECEIKIHLFDDGRLEKVQIVKSSGNDAYDAISEQAVYKAAPFPMPQNIELVKKLQDIVFVFVGDDMYV